jgi:peptide-methionine (S)-S-oxide reductase
MNHWKRMLPLFILTLIAFACESQTQGGADKAVVLPAASGPANLGPDGVIDIEKVDDSLDNRGLAEATFAGGCFWCTEAVFERVEGVEAVYSGYTGGGEIDPTYEQVSSGATNHTEAVRVYYDSTVVDYRTLLEVFFATHDPTQLNRQGPDVGPQYRSGVFYHDEQQRRLAEAYRDELQQSGKYDRLIVTEITPLDVFYKAEAYHQNYYEQEYPPNAGYVRSVTRPKVEKFVKEYPQLLKERYRAGN